MVTQTYPACSVPLPFPVILHWGPRTSGSHLTLITLKGHERIRLGIEFPTHEFYGTHQNTRVEKVGLQGEFVQQRRERGFSCCGVGRVSGRLCSEVSVLCTYMLSSFW